jgi:hypothetical protein
MARYASESYWTERYSHDREPFDWFQRFATCAPFAEALRSIVSKSDQLLIVGAGTSRLGEEMYADGYTNVYNLEISPLAVKLLDDRYARAGGLPIDNRIGDATALAFNDGSFDALIDKGTLDALLCADLATGHAMLAEASRVLRQTGGLFVHITDSPPDVRLPLLNTPAFRWRLLEHFTLPRPGTTQRAPVVRPGGGDAAANGAEPDLHTHHMYVMKRSATASK